MGKKLNEVPVHTIPEVAAYEEVEARYQKFREDNPEYFKFLDALEEELNQKLEAADKAVRAAKVSCGKFELYKYATKYNAEELFTALGRKKFLEVGGKIQTRTVYDVDKARIDQAIKNGDIRPAVAGRAIVTSPNYHKPKGISIP